MNTNPAGNPINSLFFHTSLILLLLISIMSYVFVFFLNPYIHEIFTNSRLLELVPFLKGFEDPNLLTNDYYSQIIREPNPKTTYAYFLFYTSKIFNATAYESLYIISSFSTLVLPVLNFLVITKTAQYLTGNLTKTAIALAVLTSLLLPGISKLLGVGFWLYSSTFVVANFLSVIIPDANAFSTILSLIFFILYNPHDSQIKNLPAIIFVFFASLFNPVIVLGVLVLTCLLYFLEFINKSKVKLAVLFTFGWLIPVIILKIFFSSQSSISSQEFLDLYIKYRHSHHYEVPYAFNLNYFLGILKNSIILSIPEFLTSTVLFFAYFINLILPLTIFICALLALIKKYKAAAYFLFTVASIYVTYIILQHLINTTIIYKPLIQFSPLRLTSFGVLYTGIAIIITTNILFTKTDKIYLPFRGTYKTKPVLVITIIFGIIAGYTTLSNTRTFEENMSSYYPEMLPWIKKNTDANDIFVSDCDLTFTSPADALQAIDRAVVISQRYIYNEKYIKDYTQRVKEICGPVLRDDNPNTTYTSVYFNTLSEEQYQDIVQKYNVDYMILRNSRAESIRLWEIVYLGAEYSIFKIK